MFSSAISQGLLWSVLGLGIFMTYRILNFPDMTTEGSFPLGGVLAVTLISQGHHPLLATLVAVLGGCLAGLVTGLLYTKGKIPTILAGILTMTGLHSVMFWVMGRANLGILEEDKIQDLLPFSTSINLVLVGLVVVSLVLAAMMFFLHTQLGQAYIATGDNPDMARSFGIATDKMEVLGLVLSNGLIALAGALISQQDGYADVGKGAGVIVIGLAAIIIGEVLVSGQLSLFERLLTIVLGAIIYQLLMLVIISLGLNPNYLKLVSALVLAVSLMLPEWQKKFLKGGH